jgi:hypothetical protein
MQTGTKQRYLFYKGKNYDLIPSEHDAGVAHDGKICVLVKSLPSWRYLVRFEDGVELTAAESEIAKREGMVDW